MIPQAGIALFFFGNKRDASGSVVMADGIEEEFQLALKKALIVVPIGCTGSMAAVLHKRVSDHFADYYPERGYKLLFAKLGKM
jgi:hypothetical protein